MKGTGIGFGRLFVCAILLAGMNARAQGWPEFRGPTGQGLSPGKDVPIRWSATENVAWKTAVPGVGWSSPVVWGDQVWLTTATKKGETLYAKLQSLGLRLL